MIKMTYVIRLFYKYRGLVKWYDRGLQNLWREFDSLIPCSKKHREFGVFLSCCIISVEKGRFLVFLLQTVLSNLKSSGTIRLNTMFYGESVG